MNFIKTLTLILLVLFMAGCNRSQENSFLDLKQAFIGWFLKSHPIISQDFNQLDNIEGWRDFSKDGLDEYFADLQRFFIELSQIDRSKLSDDLEFEYLVLWSFLRNTTYYESRLSPYRFDFTIWSNILQEGLEYINLECGTLTAREEKILKSRLYGLKHIAQNIESHTDSPLNVFIKDGTENINIIKKRMLTFLNECETDTNLYSRWNSPIFNSYENLNKIINNIRNQEIFINPNIDKSIWENGYEIYFGQFLEELISEEVLNNEIQKTFSIMLETALPLYLKEYDEPIWVSIQDTLQVLKTVFKSFDEKNINGIELVNKSKNILNDLEYQFKNQYFKDLKYPEFNFKVSDSSLHYKADYISNFNNGYSANFYLPKILDSTLLINEHLLEYQIINQIFPGKLTLNIQSSNSSNLLKLLKDNIFLNGWELYIQDILAKSNYFKNKPEVLLLILENKLVSMLKLKSQIKMYDDKEYDLESNMVFSEFAKKSLTTYWMRPYPVMDYLIFKEILELKKFHFKNDNNNINSFNNLITLHGPHFIFVRQNLVN
ncbi:MAG: hypothetical protein CMF96_03825 [Candidatus Marinimicrobia bacterium]|nr:hypothetical protein [Candidatus Neomarinimicrobiota bacterium]